MKTLFILTAEFRGWHEALLKSYLRNPVYWLNSCFYGNLIIKVKQIWKHRMVDKHHRWKGQPAVCLGLWCCLMGEPGASGWENTSLLSQCRTPSASDQHHLCCSVCVRGKIEGLLSRHGNFMRFLCCLLLRSSCHPVLPLCICFLL